MRKRGSRWTATKNLDLRAAKVSSSCVNTATDGDRDIVDQIDNASLQVKVNNERLQATAMCSDMAPWTAVGTTYLRKLAGMRRHERNKSPPQQVEASKRVPNWVATNPDSPLYGFCVHVPEDSTGYRDSRVRPSAIRPGLWCAWPPDVQLPNDVRLLREAGFQKYDHHSAGIFEVLKDILNVSPALSHVTFVPQDRLLKHALREELKQAITRTIVRNGALNDISTSIPEVKPTQFLQNEVCYYAASEPWRPNSRSCSTAEYEGWAMRSKTTNPLGWDGDEIYRVEYQQHAPMREDEMSAVGNMRVEMDAARRHGCMYSGKPSQRPDGEGNRPGVASDVGTQEQRKANIRAIEKEVHKAKFPSAEVAKAVVEGLAMLKSHDELGGQLHGLMTIVKHILECHWSVCGLEDIREALRRTNFRPDQEGKELRKKLHLLDELLLTHLSTMLRRFHTQGGLDDAKVPHVAPGVYDSERYVDAFLDFVAATNEDGELRAWNHLTFDLLVPLSLHRKAIHWGDGEYQMLLLKHCVPFLSACGSHKVVKSFVDIIAAPYMRSERRNMLYTAHASISINTGTPGKMVPWDSLQEYFVLMTKKFMPQTLSNANLQRVLYRNTGNLGVPLRLLPYIRETLARLKPTEASSRLPSKRTELRELARIHERAYFPFTDGNSKAALCQCVIVRGKLCKCKVRKHDVGKLMHASVVKVDGLTNEQLESKSLAYVHPGEPPCVMRQTRLGLGTSSRVLPLGTFLLAVTKEPSKERDGGNFSLDKDGNARGFMKLPCEEETTSRLPSDAEQQIRHCRPSDCGLSLTYQRTVQEAACKTGYHQVEWASPKRTLSDAPLTCALKKSLPHEAFVLAVGLAGGGWESLLECGPDKALSKVWAALGAGLAVKVASMISLSHVLSRYNNPGKLPPVFSTGVPCTRNRETGLFVKSAQRRRAAVTLQIPDGLSDLNLACLSALSFRLIGTKRETSRLRLEWEEQTAASATDPLSSDAARLCPQLRELLPSGCELIQVGEHPLRVTSSTSDSAAQRKRSFLSWPDGQEALRRMLLHSLRQNDKILVAQWASARCHWKRPKPAPFANVPLWLWTHHEKLPRTAEATSGLPKMRLDATPGVIGTMRTTQAIIGKTSTRDSASRAMATLSSSLDQMNDLFLHLEPLLDGGASEGRVEIKNKGGRPKLPFNKPVRDETMGGHIASLRLSGLSSTSPTAVTEAHFVKVYLTKLLHPTSIARDEFISNVLFGTVVRRNFDFETLCSGAAAPPAVAGSQRRPSFARTSPDADVGDTRYSARSVRDARWRSEATKYTSQLRRARAVVSHYMSTILHLAGKQTMNQAEGDKGLRETLKEALDRARERVSKLEAAQHHHLQHRLSELRSDSRCVATTAAAGPSQGTGPSQAPSRRTGPSQHPAPSQAPGPSQVPVPSQPNASQDVAATAATVGLQTGATSSDSEDGLRSDDGVQPGTATEGDGTTSFSEGEGDDAEESQSEDVEESGGSLGEDLNEDE